MSEDLIRYDVLVQDALRGVVKRVLSEVARTGLPGEHHFFIQFDTNAAGVRISSRLREEYPEEMTIVIQHQFWDMVVSEHVLEIGLSFGGVPEKLVVPFSAVKGFFDPSVQFGLQFEPQDTNEDEADLDDETTSSKDASETLGRALTAVDHTTVPADQEQQDNAAVSNDDTVSSASSSSEAAQPQSTQDDTDGDDGDDDNSSGGADVVSLDSFRKRT